MLHVVHATGYLPVSHNSALTSSRSIRRREIKNVAQSNLLRISLGLDFRLKSLATDTFDILSERRRRRKKNLSFCGRGRQKPLGFPRFPTAARSCRLLSVDYAGPVLQRWIWGRTTPEDEPPVKTGKPVKKSPKPEKTSDAPRTQTKEPVPSPADADKIEQERLKKEEAERKIKLQIYVFVLRCIAYPFNAKQPTDMARRQQKVSDH